MSAPPSFLLLFLLPLFSLLISTAESQYSLTCANVEADLTPCLPYLIGTGPLCASCCTAVSGLSGEVSGNNAALQSACECLQTLANTLPDINYGAAENLPQQCGVNLPFTISPNINCYNL